MTQTLLDFQRQYKPSNPCLFSNLPQSLASSPVPHFNGPSYDPKFDQARLTGQIRRIYNVMLDEQWWTLAEIAQTTNDPQASISAQLRHLRKPRFGGHTINKRRRGAPGKGWWEYQLKVKE